MSEVICTEEYEQAPFCKGPSEEQPHTEDHWGCEENGTCDDSFTDHCVEQGTTFDYTTGTCETVVEPVDAPVAPVDTTLPHTGVEGALVPIALALIVVGTKLRRGKWRAGNA